MTALSVRENVDLLKPPLLGWVKELISLPTKYDKPLRIVVQSKQQLLSSRCENARQQGESIEQCIKRINVLAFYRPSTSTIHFPDYVDMSGAYGIGTLMHELTHYVQDITGRWRCTAGIESEAYRNELLLADVYPMTYQNRAYLNKYIKQFDEKDCTD